VIEKLKRDIKAKEKNGCASLNENFDLRVEGYCVGMHEQLRSIADEKLKENDGRMCLPRRTIAGRISSELKRDRSKRLK